MATFPCLIKAFQPFLNSFFKANKAYNFINATPPKDKLPKSYVEVLFVYYPGLLALVVLP